MKQNSIALPIAIVVAASLIAGAIYFNGKNTDNPNLPAEQETKEITVKPVSATDHIRGNPNAPIVMVEYSDYDCPFCSQFHSTMKRVMDKYGTDGNIAWVYRHFPLTQLHPNATKIAAASECVNEIAGNDAFWEFTDLIFSEKPVETKNGQNYIGFTDITRLPEFAEQAGAERSRFELCYNSGKYDDAIQTAVADAQAAGGTGTPHTLIVAGNEVLATIPGAFPFENFRNSAGTVQSGMDEILANLISQIPTQ